MTVEQAAMDLLISLESMYKTTLVDTSATLVRPKTLMPPETD
jgi:hypothetical protein